MRLAEAGFKLKKFVTNSDELHFRVKANEQTTQKQDPAVGINPFFYPLGVISPVTVLFKMFFQCLCEVRVGWDAPFSGDLLREWNKLLSLRTRIFGDSLMLLSRLSQIRPVADLEIQKGGFNHWRAKRSRKFLGCHAHFRSRWKSKLNILKQL